MRTVDLIEHKKRGGEHAPDDIRALVRAYHRGQVPDYQMAAWLMAVRWQGMSLAETEAMTWGMVESGDSLDLGELQRPWIDKHSTGGVGDKLTLVVVPLLVAAGATVVKLSGPGLGHTGGTVDKLASIPGLRLSLDAGQLLDCARRAGGCLAGHSGSLVPADGMVYALREATATVDSLPLIAASIMSKKLASGAETIVFDVKVGRGGLLGDLAASRDLARTMIGIATRAGRRAVALLTAMDQPLGLAVGNALEVNEAVDVLRGGGPADVRALSISLCGAALRAAGLAPTAEGGEARAAELLDGGAGLGALERIILTQGGDAAAVLTPAGLPLSPLSRTITTLRSGTIARVDALTVGNASVILGAGRSVKGEPVDRGAGVLLHVKGGDTVRSGQALATAYGSDQARLEAGARRLAQAFSWAGDGETLWPPAHPRTLAAHIAELLLEKVGPQGDQPRPVVDRA